MTPPRSVLIVDDAKVIRMTLQKVLQRLGVPARAITEAETGEAALARVAEPGAEPHVVFLDMMMPGLDGEATCRAILESAPEAKVVFLTGVSRDDERVRRMISEGAFGYIEKPIRSDDVKRILETIEREELGYERLR